MNTFGHVNWREYYSISKRRRAAEERERRKRLKAQMILRPALLPPKPCTTCEVWNCHKPIDPDYPSFCPVYGQWVSEAWHIVTKRLKGELK